MISTNLDFSGLAGIAKDLETLSRAENNKVLRDATRAGAEVLKDEVEKRAPVKTGKLKKNVVVVTQKARRRGDISSGVHIRGVNPVIQQAWQMKRQMLSPCYTTRLADVPTVRA